MCIIKTEIAWEIRILVFHTLMVLLLTANPSAWAKEIVHQLIARVELWFCSCISFITCFACGSLVFTIIAVLCFGISMVNPRASTITQFNADVIHWNEDVQPLFAKQRFRNTVEHLNNQYADMSFRTTGPFPGDVHQISHTDMEDVKTEPVVGYYYANNAFSNNLNRRITDLSIPVRMTEYFQIFTQLHQAYLLPNQVNGYAKITTAEVLPLKTKAWLRCYEQGEEKPSKTAQRCKTACSTWNGHFDRYHKVCLIARRISMDDMVFLYGKKNNGLIYGGDQWKKSLLSGYDTATGMNMKYTTTYFSAGVPIDDTIGGTPVYIFNEADPLILYTHMGGFGLTAAMWLAIALVSCFCGFQSCCCIACTPLYSFLCVGSCATGIASTRNEDYGEGREPLMPSDNTFSY